MVKTGVQQSASEMYPQPVELRSPPCTTRNLPNKEGAKIGRLVAVAPNICGSSLRNLPHITLVAPIICGSYIFLKICAPLTISFHLHLDQSNGILPSHSPNNIWIFGALKDAESF
jgi:hypothetical protein